jgi:sugar phosphate isomerase/epimerase
MKDYRIGAGLYIVREDARRDLSGTLRKIRDIGYDGVELLGFFGAAPAALADMLNDLGLEALGDHVPVADVRKDPDAVVRAHKTVGAKYVTLSLPRERAEDPFERLVAEFAEAARLLEAANIVPMYHNHDFDMLGDAPLAARLLDAVPTLRFEPDVGWMLVAGKNPADYLIRYRGRVPVVHLKDVFVDESGFSFRPTGYGAVNTPALLPAILACEPAWLMVDHDFAYDRDSYDDLALSLSYVRALLCVAKETS